jgi:hypothetical protein
MIIKIKQNAEIINFLKRGGYINLNILGYLDYNKDADVYLFDGSADNGLIVGDADCGTFFLAADNPDFLTEFWRGLPNGEKMFPGAYLPYALALIENKQIKKKLIWKNPCNVYTLTGKFEPYENSSFKDDVLTLDDAEEVNNYYTYKSEHSIFAIRESILKRDTSCVRINGELASWCCVHANDASMGPLFTKEKFRGRGIGAVTASRLIEKLLAKDIVPFGHIVENNNASIAMVSKIKGMKYTHDCLWFGAEK